MKKEIITNFINKIKNDPKWIGDEYESLNPIYQYFLYLEGFIKGYKYSIDTVDDLNWVLESALDNFIMDNDEKDYDWYEEDIQKINTEIRIKLMPTWMDTSSQWCNLGKLIKTYDLDIDDLYFDADSNSIKDSEGNHWFN